jgi:hypothetical protein
MNPYKKATFVWLLLSTFPLAIAVLIIVYTDPYSVMWDSPASKGLGYSNFQRIQNAGIIRKIFYSEDDRYDAIVIGTSMTENMDENAVKRATASKGVVRLSIGGGTAKEQALTATYALSSNRISTVVWGLNTSTWNRNRDNEWHHTLDFYTEIYDEYPINDFRYYTNIDILRESLKVLDKEKFGFHYTLEGRNKWRPERKNKFDYWSTSENLDKNVTPHIVPAISLETIDLRLNHQFKAIDTHLQPIIEQYCNTEINFIFFVPPYSLLYYRTLSKFWLIQSIYFPRRVLQHINDCRNMTLYGFSHIGEIVGNIKYYMDFNHYSKHVDDIIVESFLSRENILSLDNIDSYEESMITSINNYSLESILEVTP